MFRHVRIERPGGTPLCRLRLRARWDDDGTAEGAVSQAKETVHRRIDILGVKEAALYPGDVVNRRVRWDDKQAELVTERPLTAADYAAIHGHARPIEAAIKAFRAQIKNPLNPGDAVVLVAIKRFGLLGDTLIAEDAAGARLVIRDPRKAVFKTSPNLRCAAGAFGPGSLAVRLWFDLLDRAVYGQALSLIAGEKILRLGM